MNSEGGLQPDKAAQEGKVQLTVLSSSLAEPSWKAKGKAVCGRCLHSSASGCTGQGSKEWRVDLQRQTENTQRNPIGSSRE